jgi:hypothetical protein
MGVKAHPGRSEASFEPIPPVNESQKAAVLRALDDIRNSKAFRTSKRCKQFLSYIVERTLEGQGDLLKERTLGVELFRRLPTYSTGDDPVVRVEAGEVRRRLKQYYTAEAQSPEVRIEIPVGSYVPGLYWDPSGADAAAAKNPRLRVTAKPLLLVIATTALVVMGVCAIIFAGHKRVQPASVVEGFWAPLLKTPQPVLICLPSPVVYQPSTELYERYTKTHPGTYQTPGERWAAPLNLDPNEQVPWKDMRPYANTYVAKEDAYVAGEMLAVFAGIGKPCQTKSLSTLSIRDLRNSPAFLIGAFSNRWTMELGANLPFYFDQGQGEFIREHGGAGRFWRSQYVGGKLTQDYAIVTRQPDSSTGQALIVAAGIERQGTEAAGEFLSRSDYLSNGLRAAPPGWQNMNFQAVLQTDVTDGVAGPAKVVATRFW